MLMSTKAKLMKAKAKLTKTITALKKLNHIKIGQSTAK